MAHIFPVVRFAAFVKHNWFKKPVVPNQHIAVRVAVDSNGRFGKPARAVIPQENAEEQFLKRECF
ncbi:hypothetical protein LJC36_05745 [Desulfovibrio sp. OttesenSCG-928-C14]|nr:hypothetical protein [Desulfovibrio sp. OttesenSCG-928-C14]